MENPEHGLQMGMHEMLVLSERGQMQHYRLSEVTKKDSGEGKSF